MVSGTGEVAGDALDNLSGRYSFSAAIVDDYGDGLIVTTIHGRSDTRSYLKEITAGKSDIDLSPEESALGCVAVTDALNIENTGGFWKWNGETHDW